MDKYQKTFKTWNKVASLYEEKFMDVDLYDQTYDLFCNQVKQQNPSILEIGCGPGNITKYLLTKRPDFNILGIDIAPKMIELAKKNNPEAEFKVMDSRAINQLKKQYDAIICGFCLPYLSEKDRLKLVQDCSNLLHNKGQLYISFVAGNYDKSGFISGSSGDEMYFYYHPLAHLEEELQDNNFNILNVIKVNYPRAEGVEEHTILLAEKITNGTLFCPRLTL